MTNKQIHTDEQLLAQVDELAKEISPKRDLWPGIEQAIAAQSQEVSTLASNDWSAWSKIAAAFAPVALVLGLWFNTPAVVDGQNELFNPVVASFEIQKRQLLKQVSSNTTVVENWQHSLVELEQAEAALLKALQSQPGEPALINMLTQVYQQQLNLIQKAHKPELNTQFSQI